MKTTTALLFLGLFISNPAYSAMEREVINSTNLVAGNLTYRIRVQEPMQGSLDVVIEVSSKVPLDFGSKVSALLNLKTDGRYTGQFPIKPTKLSPVATYWFIIPKTLARDSDFTLSTMLPGEALNVSTGFLHRVVLTDFVK